MFLLVGCRERMGPPAHERIEILPRPGDRAKGDVSANINNFQPSACPLFFRAKKTYAPKCPAAPIYKNKGGRRLNILFLVVLLFRREI